MEVDDEYNGTLSGDQTNFDENDLEIQHNPDDQEVSIGPIEEHDSSHDNRPSSTATTTNEDMENYIQRMVNEKVKLALQERGVTGKDMVDNKAGKTDKNLSPERTPLKRSGLVKSPSDTTIYAPVLKLTPKVGCINQVNSQCHNNEQSIVDKIANFVTQVRLESESALSDNRMRLNILGGECAVGKEVVAKRDDQPQASGSGQNKSRFVVGQADPMSAAREEAERLITEAERFKATVEPPKGKEIEHNAYTDSVDDEFFHITCHIDQAVKAKIERGEFIELEKLLVRDRLFNRSMQSDSRLALYNIDGFTYVAAAYDREGRISGVCKWEQAFRVYAATFSKANPSRASEIWQYV